MFNFIFRMTTFVLVLFVLMFNSNALLADFVNDSIEVTDLKADGASTKDETNNSNAALKEHLKDLLDQVYSQNKDYRDSNKALEDIIHTQNLKIRELEILLVNLNEKPVTNGTTFEVWSSIALGASALALTFTAVGIAVFGLISFGTIKTDCKQLAKAEAEEVARNEADKVAKNTSKEVAQTEAKAEAEKVARDITPDYAVYMIADHIGKGGFDKLISEAVDRVAFSNINAPDDEMENSLDEA